MFGKNPIRSQELRDDGSLNVISIFYTLQGEGPHAGSPAVFLRLAGCALRCEFCDTQFEEGARLISLPQLIEDILTKGDRHTSLLVITGGEPMLQNIAPLIVELEMQGWDTQIETSGTHWAPGVEQTSAHIVCSPKTGSINKKVMAHCNDYKFIYGTGDQFIEGAFVSKTQPASHAIALLEPPASATVWVQPRDDGDLFKNTRNMELARDLCLAQGFRLSLQVHKLVNLE